MRPHSTVAKIMDPEAGLPGVKPQLSHYYLGDPEQLT